MSTLPIIRAFLADDWRTYRALRLRSLADSPDAFGSTLAEEQERPDATWAARLASGTSSGRDLPLLVELNGQPIGLAWGRFEGSDSETAHLYQMWVDPAHRRIGAGRMLLNAVIAWAKALDAHTLALGVTSQRSAAIQLYVRAGFRPTGELQPLRSGSPLLVQSMHLDLNQKARRNEP